MLGQGEEAVSRSTSSQLPQKMRLEETPGDDAAGAGSLRTSAPPNSSRFHDQASSRESRRSTGKLVALVCCYSTSPVESSIP